MATLVGRRRQVGPAPLLGSGLNLPRARCHRRGDDQWFEREINILGVVLAPQRMDTQKMAREFLTEPVTVLGQRHPRLQVALIRKIPGVQGSRQGDGRTVGDADFQPQIRVGDGPAEQVGLDAYCLGS